MIYDYFDNKIGDTINTELIIHHEGFVRLEKFDNEKNYFIAHFKGNVIVLLRYYTTDCYKVLDVQFI